MSELSIFLAAFSFPFLKKSKHLAGTQEMKPRCLTAQDRYFAKKYCSHRNRESPKQRGKKEAFLVSLFTYFMMKTKPDIRPGLLWEYNLETFHWDRSYKIVIERVVQRGWIDEWKEIFEFYGPDKILEAVEWSKQLDNRDKNFARLFLKSDLLHAA